MSEALTVILGGAAGAAFFTGMFSVVQWFLNRWAKKKDRAAENKADECAARGEEIKALKAGVDASNEANRVLLYDRIKHLAKTYISRHHITAEELEDLIAMHECYHTTLNGNGFLDDLMAQVRRLPIK